MRIFTLGSGNGALMYSIFGGNVNDLRCWLTEERFPDGWEPMNREALGHTIMVGSLQSSSQGLFSTDQMVRTAGANHLACD